MLIQTVAKLSSTIALSSNPNPANFGQAVQIAATVTSSGNPPPSGIVRFRDGSKDLQNVTLISGVASFKVSNLSIGSHSITGTYSGDLVHAGVTSAPVVQQISAAPATVSLSASLNPSFYGQNVTFTANVGSSAGVPTGAVTFSNGSQKLGKTAL